MCNWQSDCNGIAHMPFECSLRGVILSSILSSILSNTSYPLLLKTRTAITNLLLQYMLCSTKSQTTICTCYTMLRHNGKPGTPAQTLQGSEPTNPLGVTQPSRRT